ncbi:MULTISPECIES: hypothetical protein [unclassified Oceanispirochaeta]|uniref:hypothetical protein n=1 Tax=unclassified Oceanispirochaeta TaxID=2635722 RepID=UPI000E097875|nr:MULTISPECIES: hypothetical protein [unclassified Oceanispirochaeta]MBF9015492.1 hypothetical protein [Oceanispirochaeta sp. M2]NPD71951.1 hypothetical protein [Oceanispirochaeta sp. M1]RDG32758.1 hypothetical protein DV872_07555 [Oceanispirochaeta sp. M1]
MILTVKKFLTNKDNDYESMTSRVGQMRIFLEHILAGRVPNEKYSQDSLLQYCRSLVEGQRDGMEGLDAGSWSVSPSPLEIAEDDKNDYHFFPTYIALATLVFCGEKDSRVKDIPGYDDALKKGFSFAVSSELNGYGFNSLFQQMEAVLILGSGGCPRYLVSNPDSGPVMISRLKELGNDFQQRLDKDDTILSFGGDYKRQFTLACKLLEPLMEKSV